MRWLLMLALVLLPSIAQAEPPTSFDSAKDAAVVLWWEIGPVSFYCQCPYRPATVEEKMIRSGNLWVVGSVCGYRAKDLITSSGKPNARTTRIEWEHVVPADWIATGFGCQDMTRSECRTIDGFEPAEGDLFNLVPAIGELNGDRNARLYGDIPGEPRAYGACDFEVDATGDGPAHSRGMAEPMPSIRGDLARVWFYMIDRYNLVLSEDFKAMLQAWSVLDPIDKAERERHAVIAAEMGWNNPFVVGE